MNLVDNVKKDIPNSGGASNKAEFITFAENSWRLPPENLILSRDEVHVWRAHLGLSRSRIQSLYQILSLDEQARARRFHFRRDHDHFIAARGLLRSILGRYLKREPGGLRFCYSTHGKPRLSEQPDEDILNFNLSHSHGLALFAITRGRELGVDLEYVQAGLVDEEIAERFFCPGEISTLRALPKNVQPQAFYACWTRKEAYIKAKGEGLSMPLDQFEVSLSPGYPATLLWTNVDQEEASRWELKELSPGSGCVAALCVQGHDWRLKCWHWPGG